MTVSAERLQQARKVADAVLYEGYLLYPYRASSEKNVSRWQFGVLGPPGAADRGLGEADTMTMHTILTDVTQSSSVTVHLRFLQLQHRQVRDAAGHDVASLPVDGRTEISWDEAVEQELALTFTGLSNDAEPSSTSTDNPVSTSGGADVEALPGGGSVVRRRWPLHVVVEASTEQHGPYTRLTLRVRNDHPDRPTTKEEATRTSLLGAHLLVEADGCGFGSVVDPPEGAREVVDRSRQDRCWPFLAGVEGETDLLLGSPIILYDYPEVAAESAGALFDATEIDEILTLRVMTMTDAEKAEARATDPRAAAIIDRCDAMSPGDLQQLHGIFRDPRGPAALPLDEPPTFTDTGGSPWWDPASDASVDPASDSVVVGGVPIRKGSRVRVRPTRRADAQDLFFADQVARVTAVLFDVDGDTHVAVVLEGDPAADLHDWYGRYFYFAPDEIEPLIEREESRP
ncbi:MAG: hypothetical protein JWR85_2373 [Marmoricola sp.]|nr:hypothetical protein [Marmoricola sp.]